MPKKKTEEVEDKEEKKVEASEKASKPKKTTKSSKTTKAKNDEEIKSLKEELEKQKAELESQKEIFLRTAAEYDNYRKRTEREKTNVYNDATANAVLCMLPAIDSLERAVEAQSGGDENYLKGLTMILNQMKEAFKNLKVEEFGEKGEEFNPELHNAVAHTDDDSLGDNVIAVVFQKGYKIGDKIVRHAMVQVAN